MENNLLPAAGWHAEHSSRTLGLRRTGCWHWPQGSRDAWMRGAAVPCPPSFPWWSRGFNTQFWCSLPLPTGYPWGRSVVNEGSAYGLGCEERLSLISVGRCSLWSGGQPPVISWALSASLCRLVTAPHAKDHGVSDAALASSSVPVPAPAPSAHVGMVGWRVRPLRKANEIQTRQHLSCCKGCRKWRGEPGPQRCVARWVPISCLLQLARVDLGIPLGLGEDPGNKGALDYSSPVPSLPPARSFWSLSQVGPLVCGFSGDVEEQPVLATQREGAWSLAFTAALAQSWDRQCWGF